MKKRKIAVITGARADYGHLYPLIRQIQEDRALQLQLVVTGMHLSSAFGNTYRDILKDGFSIDAKVLMDLTDDSPQGIAKSIGRGVAGFAEVFSRLKPDIAVILGDRFEMLAAAQACMLSRVPIAHLHGGESTEGVFDEAIRHCITKMSHFHFTAAEPYRKRVIQMGENPARVFNYGALALDNIKKLPLLSRPELQQNFKLPFKGPFFLVTYHPATLSVIKPAAAFKELLRALESFPEFAVLFTKSNADSGGRVINALMDRYVAKNKDRAVSFTAMGASGYLSAMKAAGCVIGNSSSGIYEAPMLKKPVVNIGPRQSGRLKAASILDCGESAPEIRSAVKKALSASFHRKLSSAISLYGQGDAAPRIKNALKRVNLGGVLMKKFFDAPSFGLRQV